MLQEAETRRADLRVRLAAARRAETLADLSKPVTLAALTGLLDQVALGELAGSAGGSAAGV